MKQKLIIASYLAIVIGPLLLGFGYSLLYSLGMVGVLGKGFTFVHWQRLLADKDALGSLVYTAYLTIISLVGSALIAMVVAYWLTFYQKHTKLLYSALFLPLAMPPLIAAFAILYVLSPSGMISRIGNALGIYNQLEDFPRLVNDIGGIGIIASHLLMVAPFFSIMFTNIAKQENMLGLKQIGATLGASTSDFAMRIFFPVLLKKGTPLLLLYGIFFFGAYEVPLLLGQQAPQAVTVFITEKMDKFDLMNIPVGHAMATVYTMIVALLATFFLRRASKG